VLRRVVIWCVLMVPPWRWNFFGLFARFLRAPLTSGMIVTLTVLVAQS
jgi:hypothetical protein